MDFKKIRFSLLEISYWCAMGAYPTFVISYFIYDRGYTATVTGVLMSAYTLAAFVGQFFWNYLSDRIRSNKVIAVFTNACGAALYLALYFSQPLPLVSVLYTLLGFIMPSLSTNIDTWILKTYADTPYVYGPIRSVGSLFYAVFMLFYGGLLLKYGYILMLWFGLSFVAVSMLLIVSLPDAPQRPKSETAPVKKHGVVGGVFLLMLAAMFISNISLTPVGSMIAVTLKKLHGSAADQAYFLCAHALLEFPMMLLTYKLAQFIKPVNRLFISCVTYTVALVYIVVTQTPSGIILASALLGVGYGLFLPALREYVFAVAPKGRENAMQGVTDTVGNNLSAAIGSTAAGTIADVSGVPVLLYAAMVLQGVSTAMFFLLTKLSRRVRAKE
jgi:PPP family 3-phenylpropionic acid transporter